MRLPCRDAVALISALTLPHCVFCTTFMYYIVFDGNCNLCTNLVRALETIDRGQQFQYIAMQDRDTLATFNITPQDCEQGMILLDASNLNRRWQGSSAAEEIGRLLPLGSPLVALYRAMPGLKPGGDRVYEHVRDHRYELFGEREITYTSAYPVCSTGTCNVSQ